MRLWYIYYRLLRKIPPDVRYDVSDVLDRIATLATYQINHSGGKVNTKKKASVSDVRTFTIRMAAVQPAMSQISLLRVMKKEAWFPGVEESTEWRIRCGIDGRGLDGKKGVGRHPNSNKGYNQYRRMPRMGNDSTG